MSQSRKRKTRPSSSSQEDLIQIKKQRLSESESSNNNNASISKEHRKGSVVRVRLENFVTYDFCEFFPGPLLNVVIGPNGSGKSSIVCGLVLGLGGSPKLLGRAKQPKEFIRHGAKQATIELELAKTNKNGTNAIITRTIRDDNSSDWRLNNKIVSKKDVETFIQSNKIQIDNVCQFLPQDKVVEFAKLDQYQLLKETEKAIGEPKMIKRHEMLIEMYQNQSKGKLELQTKEKHLEDLKKKNELLERDVIRFRERERLIKQVKKMKKKIPWIKLKEAETSVIKIEKEFKKLQKKLQNEQKKTEPLQKEIESIQNKVNSIENSRKKNQEIAKTLDKQRQDNFRKLNVIADKFQASILSLERLKSRSQDRKNQLEIKKQNLQRLEAHSNQIDLQKIEQSRIEIENEYKNIRKQDDEIREQIANIDYIKNQKEEQSMLIQRQISQLTNQKKRILDELKGRSRDAYTVKIWVEEQEKLNKFQQKIYGPLLLEITINDEYHARCFESQTPFWLLEAFICQNVHDYDFLMDNIMRQKLTVNVTRTDKINGDFSHPDNLDVLKRFGVSGWLSDYIQAPETIILCLKANCNIHSCAIGSNNTNPKVFFDNARTRRLYTPENVYSTTVSKYGNRNKSTSVMPLRPSAKFMKGIDNNALARLQQQYASIKGEIQGEEAKKREFDTQLRSISEKLSYLKSKREELLKNMQKKKEYQSRIKELKRQIVELQQEEDTSQKEKEINDEIQKKINLQIEVSKHIKTVMEKETKLSLEIDFLVIERAEIAKTLIAKKNELDVVKETYKTIKIVHDQKEREFAEARHSFTELKKDAQNRAPLTAELKEEFKTFPDNLEDLNLAIVEAKAKADLNYRSNPHLIEDYERRCAEIKELQSQIDDLVNGSEASQAKMEKIKSQWLPPLKDLVDKISISFTKYFRNIGCFGRVELAEDEDFAKYGIQIHVAFRLDQEAQILDACTQSGGVSYIL